MKRIMIIYNPRSSQYGRVCEEVLTKVRGLKGWIVGKYEVLDTHVDDNAERLAKLLNDGDLVVSAGGDGTATIAMNAIMLSKAEDVKFGVLGYGNFNDMARTFGTKDIMEIVRIADGKEGRVAETWGLECLVNDKHWRYGMCYFTIGLFAEACVIFDKKDARKKLQTGKKGLLYSILLLAKWYFKNRKKRFLPDFELVRNSENKKYEGMTDYVAINGTSMARVMRGRKWYLQNETFQSETRSLKNLWNLCRLMFVSIVKKVPGVETSGDILIFKKECSMMVMAEGEYKKLEGVQKLEMRKAKKPLKVITR